MADPGPAALDSPPTSSASPRSQPVSLENGDRLSRKEFERRYDALPDLKKAELLEEVVYVPSPVRLNRHGAPHSDLVTWLGVYRVSTPGVVLGDNTSIRLDPDNEPQPDAFLMVDPAHGGQARVDEDDYVVGGPELVAEITSSRVSYDLGPKLHVYRRNRVREYLVWRVVDREFDWFILRENQYERLPVNSTGIWCSETFPGLWLDAGALLDGDLARVHETLRQGLVAPEHSEFVAKLGARDR